MTAASGRKGLCAPFLEEWTSFLRVPIYRQPHVFGLSALINAYNRGELSAQTPTIRNRKLATYGQPNRYQSVRRINFGLRLQFQLKEDGYGASEGEEPNPERKDSGIGHPKVNWIPLR